MQSGTIDLDDRVARRFMCTLFLRLAIAYDTYRAWLVPLYRLLDRELRGIVSDAGMCALCGAESTKFCSRCRSVCYCSRFDHTLLLHIKLPP